MPAGRPALTAWPGGPSVAGDLVKRTIAFCRALRAAGTEVGPGDSVAAIRTLQAVDVGDRDDVYWGLRSALVRRREDAARFDPLFRVYFEGAIETVFGEPDAGRPPAERPDPPQAHEQAIAVDDGGEEGEDDGDAAALTTGYSPRERLATRDFSRLNAAEMEEMLRLVTRIARRLALRLSRRLRPSPRRGRIDLRRALRRSLRHGGLMLELPRRRRRTRRSRIAVLCDVSGSMDRYSRLLLQFVYALQARAWSVQSFVFSTRLTRVTSDLDVDDFVAGLRAAGSRVAGWSGGTQIGPCLERFLEHEGRPLLGRRTVVVILSDGWDTGDPRVLERAMRRLSRACGRIVWLNPLLGTPGYQPLTQGMSTALPFCDVFAPAHNLQSLRDLERYLTQTARPSAGAASARGASA